MVRRIWVSFSKVNFASPKYIFWSVKADLAWPKMPGVFLVGSRGFVLFWATVVEVEASAAKRANEGRTLSFIVKLDVLVVCQCLCLCVGVCVCV